MQCACFAAPSKCLAARVGPVLAPAEAGGVRKLGKVRAASWHFAVVGLHGDGSPSSMMCWMTTSSLRRTAGWLLERIRGLWTVLVMVRGGAAVLTLPVGEIDLSFPCSALPGTPSTQSP